MEVEEGTAEEHHHRSARERQRRGPMWGCLRWIIGGSIGFLALLVVIIGGGFYYLGTSSFAGLVVLRVEKTLEARLGRHVYIGSVAIDRAHLSRVVLNDLRIANSPGTLHPYFATVKQVVITGGVSSFWGRRISVDRVDIVEPRIYFEIYPAGAPLIHNFPHWQSGPKSRYEIYHLEFNKMNIAGGAFDFLDRRHNLAAVANNMDSAVTITSQQDLYAGTVSSPLVHFRIQDYVPFDMNMRGQFRYTPGALALQSIALDGGTDFRVFLSGMLQPLTDGVYNLRVTSVVGLNHIRDIFRLQRAFAGNLEMDANLRGKQGTFTLAGGWLSQRIRADAYDLANARGKLNVTDQRAVIDVERAEYGGGNLTAHYVLPQYAEPYPMSVDLRFNGVSVEKLFSDWGVANTGLRGAATGRLAYHWKKDKLLQGAGEGAATLAKSAIAFSQAKYPVPVGGSADFALDNGVVTFRPAELVTDKSRVSLTGKFRIEDASTDFLVKIHSDDFSELDRVSYNFAHSVGKKTYTLLGLGGTGDIGGTVKGRLKAPEVVAHITGSGTKYNNVLVGDSDIDLHYDGVHNILKFDRALFREANGRLSLAGTVEFPEHGPSPRFDLAIDASNYPVDRAVATVNLKFAVNGLGTGRIILTGTPDAGKVTFATLTVVQPGNARLHLTGSTEWKPGKGNTTFDLAIDAQSFPVADIVKFLDLGTLPVTGELTGTLRIQGPKNELEGTGSITVRNGSIFGEPVTLASANITFTKGTLRATNFTATGPAGTLTGQAEFNLNTNQFSYSIQSSSLDLSKVKALSALGNLFGGALTITSSGGGTFEQPELVLNATLNQATIRGLNLPPNAPPPSLYLAIRNGQLTVKGSVADALTIDGSGTVATDGALSGLVRIRIPDLAKFLALSPNTASLPASGSLETDLQLGGKLSAIEALRIDATFPEFRVRVSEHEFTPVRPLHIALRDGQIVFDQFQLALQQTASTFAIGGFVELTGAKRLNLDVRGTLEAALLQLFMKDVRADGHIDIAGGVHGTLSNPTLSGTAEFGEAQVRFPGFPQLFDHITGTLIFRSDRVDIEGLHANVGGGTVSAGGSIILAGLTPQRVRVALQAKDVAIRYFEGITVEGDFDNMMLAGDTGHITLQGDIRVTRALYSKDVELGGAILNVVLSRRGVTPIVAAAWQDKVSLRLHLSAPGTLAVRNNLADVTGSGDIDVNGTLANPVVLGTVTLDEGGRVRFQNIDYRIVSGTINFQNPFRIDPYFDITLEARVSGGLSEIEAGPVDVTVNLTGTLDRFTPTISSDPPASDITLFSLLGLGGLASRGGTTQPGEQGPLGKSLLFQSAARLIGSRVLPFVDAFTLDVGQLDTSGDQGTKVGFQKRISNDFTLYVVYNTRDQKNRVIVEWQVNPEWSLRFTRDEFSSEYSTEARFRRRYEGHWTWGGRGKNPMALLARFQEVTSAPLVQTNEPVAPPAGSPTVTQITFTADSKFDTSVLGQYVSVKVGQPLAIRQVQSSIKSLYDTGDFRDIRVDSTPSAGGVALAFSLFVNYRVSEIHFDGLSGADRDRATRELTFHVGDVFSLNAVDRSAVAIQTFLSRAGYLEAAVDPETTFTREQSRAAVTFHVNTGARAKVSSVVLEGEVAPFTATELIGRMKHGPGKTFQIAEARSDADRIRNFMVRRDYRKADVRFLAYTYDKTTKQVTLRYRAVAGPIVRVTVVGVPRSAVRGLIPFRKNQPYSEDAIDKASDDIVKNYQAHGYFNAAVDTENNLANNVWTTTFKVKPGLHYQLTAVTFTGNQKAWGKKLAGIVTTSVSGGFHSFFANLFRRPTGVTKAQLSADRDAIESYYRLNGFSEIQVATPVVNARNDGTMSVDFPITEGPQTILTDVLVEGNQQVPTRKLPKLSLKPGDPLNPQLERADVVALQSYYADRGNAEVQIKLREDISADKTTAKVTYVIAEGPEIKVDQVIVRGNTYTNSSVVLRQSEIDRGDPFSYTSILEAQRNLYRLGIFQRVDIEPEQTGTSVSDRNVVISVQEGKDLTLSGSGGFTYNWGLTSATTSTFSPLASISFAHRNLFGTGRYAGLELIASKTRRDAFLTYREPFVGPWAVPVQVTVFRNDDHRRAAHLVQSGTFIEASKVVQLQTRWSLRYEYRIARCLIEQENDVCAQVKNALVPGLDRSVANINISSLTPTFFWDKRDDPFDPHRGFLTSASVEYAFRAFSADAHFLKEFAQGSWYLPLTQRSVFAVSGRLGLIQSLGNPVPLTERFTAGGESSHRAYGPDLLGTTCLDPSDTSGKTLLPGCQPTLILLTSGQIAPIGGNGLFLANAEYRFPIFASVGGAMFVDAGNVFADTAIRLGDLRYGVGTGVRYLSPVGPVRFDVGYKLKRQIIGFDTKTNAPIFERPFAYFITLGYAF